MHDNIDIDTISRGLVSKSEELFSLLEEKFKIGSISNEAANRIQKLFDDLKTAAQENLTLLNPLPIDLTPLNEARSCYLGDLLCESGLKASDYIPEQQETWSGASRKRKYMYIADSIHHFFTGTSLSNQYAPLPKTIIEEKWDELEVSIKAFNDGLKRLDHTNNTYKNNRLTGLSDDLIIQILSWLELKELITITHHEPTSYFRQFIIPSANQLIMTGIKPSVFFYINPLILLINRELRQLLLEGFHPELFRIISPKRFIKTHRIDNVQYANENRFEKYIALPSDAFPENHRVIRGVTCKNVPFFSVLNSENKQITFTVHDNGVMWYDYHARNDGWGIAELKLPGPFPVLFITLLRADSTDSLLYIYSREWLQAWLTLYLGYINESCPQENGEPCNTAVLSSLTNQLLEMIDSDEEEDDDDDVQNDNPEPVRGPIFTGGAF